CAGAGRNGTCEVGKLRTNKTKLRRSGNCSACTRRKKSNTLFLLPPEERARMVVRKSVVFLRWSCLLLVVCWLVAAEAKFVHIDLQSARHDSLHAGTHTSL